MRLNAEAFDAAREKGKLRISFIGMSNIGKSYCAERLGAAQNLNVIEIDAAIQEALGQSSMAEAANWLGFPFDADYAKNAATYLDAEAQMTANAANQPANSIIDTTGSVIYTSISTLNALKNNTIIVYLQANDADIERLKDLYFTVPKPTLWGDKFERRWWQSGRNALRKCYPDLLAYRSEKYAALADITLTTSWVRSINADPEKLYAKIRG